MVENTENVEVEETKEKKEREYRLAKYKYSLQQSTDEREENGAYRTESETLSINIENMALDDAMKDIKSLINKGYDVEVTLKVKEPK